MGERRRPEGDPCRLPAPPMSSRSIFPQAEVIGDIGASADGCWQTASRASCARRASLLRLREGILGHIAERADRRPLPVTPQRLVHDVRAGHAGRRHPLPRQRHVQDLVRAQLPDPRRQHAAARQRAGHDGRGPAVGDDGGDALSRAPRHGDLRRRRLHDEQPGDGDRGPAEARPRRADPRGQRLRHDPLEAGGRSASPISA